MGGFKTLEWFTIKYPNNQTLVILKEWSIPLTENHIIIAKAISKVKLIRHLLPKLSLDQKKVVIFTLLNLNIYDKNHFISILRWLNKEDRLVIVEIIHKYFNEIIPAEEEVVEVSKVDEFIEAPDSDRDMGDIEIPVEERFEGEVWNFREELIDRKVVKQKPMIRFLEKDLYYRKTSIMFENSLNQKPVVVVKKIDNFPKKFINFINQLCIFNEDKGYKLMSVLDINKMVVKDCKQLIIAYTDLIISQSKADSARYFNIIQKLSKTIKHLRKFESLVKNNIEFYPRCADCKQIKNKLLKVLRPTLIKERIKIDKGLLQSW